MEREHSAQTIANCYGFCLHQWGGHGKNRKNGNLGNYGQARSHKYRLKFMKGNKNL